MCGRWAADASALDEGMPHYVAAFTADGIRGSCDDYRAGARIDVQHDATGQLMWDSVRSAGLRLTKTRRIRSECLATRCPAHGCL